MRCYVPPTRETDWGKQNAKRASGLITSKGMSPVVFFMGLASRNRFNYSVKFGATVQSDVIVCVSITLLLH